MVDLVCFKVDEEHERVIVDALNRDFYTEANVLACGRIVCLPDGDNKVLFLCPIILPVGGLVGSVVKKTIFRGFKSSFSKKGVNIVRVKDSKNIRGLYDNVVES